MAENIIELSALSGLSAYSVNISKMDLLSGDMQSDYKFVISRPNPIDKTYSNFNVDYAALSNSFIRDFKQADLTLKNAWHFATLNGTAKVHTSAITKSTDFNKVILNKETFEKECISEIYKLSSEIYERPHLFSHIGDIVCSHNLSSQEMLQEKYGSNTEWKQINGKFIIGVGKNEANNIESKYGVLEANKVNISAVNVTGGSEKVTLNVKNLITHNHSFNADQHNFTLSYEIHADGTLKIYTATKNQRDHGSAVKYHKATLGTLAVITFEAHGKYSTKQLYENLNVSTSIFSEDGKKQKLVAHNNMPPTIYEYVWQRTK